MKPVDSVKITKQMTSLPVYYTRLITTCYHLCCEVCQLCVTLPVVRCS